MQAQPVSFQAVLDRSQISADQLIRYGDAEPQFIELFFPSFNSSSAKQTPPLLVYIHGGCWLNSFGVDHARGLADGLRQHGFAVALVEYRRLDDTGGGWPNTLTDIENALLKLSESDTGAYQTSDITLIGHSAGGHLALLASQPHRTLTHQGFTIRGVIGLAAITDIARYAEGDSGCQQSAARFIATAPDQLTIMNPVSAQNHPQVTLLRGAADIIVGADQQYLERAKTIDIEGAGHFDVIHPDTPAFDYLLEALQQLHANSSTQAPNSANEAKP